MKAAFSYFRALRPNQWTKNAVVMAAFVFALGDRHQAVSLGQLGDAVGAMLTFCLISSGIYLLNDIRDVERDRLHPTKKFRPLAAGEISVKGSLLLAFASLAAGLTGAGFICPRLALVEAGYVLLQIIYTVWLKHIGLIELFVIAGGFVLRAVAGAVTVDVVFSPWLLLCTLLLALFLALCKRRHEKVIIDATGSDTRPSLGSYNERLLDQLIAIVSTATIVFYSLYTLWPNTIEKFGTAKLALTIPFVMFGLFRYLDLVYRHEQGGRPEKILLTDIPLIVNILLYGLTVLAVIILHI